jgi:ubiquinone/menaquinone biosynthesis C-methylase UbiE
MKQKIIHFLRKLYLLSLAEKIRMYIQFFRSYCKLAKFKKKYTEFILPPWTIAYDAYAGLNPDDYLNLGVFHARKIDFLVKKYKPDQKKLIICDWGCGPMRVLRHLPIIMRKTNKFIGLDYNKETISWAAATFPDIEFHLNGLNPPLPLKDQSADVIYAISVFTHLSEGLFRDYVKDIYRVLKKNGILIATLHGDQSATHLLKKEMENYKGGKFVARDKVEEGKRIYASYHPKSFVADAFKKYKILEHDQSIDSDIFYQDWYIFKK